jgi:hypothetical protein
MNARRIDRLAGGIQAEHVEAAAGQSLRRQPGATADIQQPKTRRGRKFPPNPLDDPGDPGWVHPVQRAHWPAGIPPDRGQSVEPRDLLG